jgi:hypothetical protein
LLLPADVAQALNDILYKAIRMSHISAQLGV